MHSVYRLLVPGALLLICTAAAQTNWPSFRGNHADGLQTNDVTPTTWNLRRSENISWKKPVPGLGHSSPIIWGEKVFVTTAVNENKDAPLKVGLYGDPGSADDNEAQQWKVLCLNKKTGEVLWQKTAHEGK